MSETVSDQIENVDIDSFIDVEEQVNNQYIESFNGLVQLKSAKIKEADRIDTKETLDYDEYIVFDCDLSDNIVIMPTNKSSDEYKFTLEWTDCESIGSLANKQIPVSKFDSGIYTPLNEAGFSEKVKTYNCKQLIKDNYVNYNNETDSWEKSDSYERLIGIGVFGVFVTATILSSIILHPLYIGLLEFTTTEYILSSLILSVFNTYIFAYLVDNHEI